MRFPRVTSARATARPTEKLPADDPPVRLQDAYRFFVPLILTAELMMLSHSVIHAALARLPNAEVTLAAYSIAFYAHATLGSPFWSGVLINLGYAKHLAGLWQTMRFQGMLLLAGSPIWFALGLTSFGDLFFGELLGAPEVVIAQAKQAMLIFWLNAPMAVARSMAYALLMQNQRTVYISVGTLVRLLALVGFLGFLTRHLDGASVGAAALAGCIGVESIYAVWVARRHFFALLHAHRKALNDSQATPPPRGAPLREIWRFAWPIFLIQAAESGVGFGINLFLGRLAQATLALAAFGVLDGILRVLLSPLRNFVPALQTLTRSPADLQVLKRFVAQVTAAFVLLMFFLWLEPVRFVVLKVLLGVSDELAAYLAPALPLGVVLALFHALGCATRGWLIGAKRTGVMAFSAAARLLAVAAIGTIALSLPGVNGALLGMFCLIAAYAAETVVQSAKLRRLRSQAAPKLRVLPTRNEERWPLFTLCDGLLRRRAFVRRGCDRHDSPLGARRERRIVGHVLSDRRLRRRDRGSIRQAETSAKPDRSETSRAADEVTRSVGRFSRSVMAFSAAARLLAVAAIGTIALSVPGVNGALLGMFCLIAAYAAETVVQSAKLRRLRSQATPKLCSLPTRRAADEARCRRGNEER